LALICSEPSIAEATDRKRQSTCRTLEFQAGQTVFSQGEFAGDIYVVKKGAVRTFLKTGTIKQNLSVLGPGDFFGETCLVDDSNELISAEAIEASDIIAVPKDIFAGFFHDPFAPGISMALIKRIRDANALLESALIEDHLIRLIYGLLFLQRSKFNGREMNFTELLESFRLPVSERLLKYVEKLESLQVVKTTDQTIQVKDTEKLESILNLLMKSGKFSLKF
jgi:CRP/FNR family transcriptional regulator, cyclic AMP receptor protein